MVRGHVRSASRIVRLGKGSDAAGGGGEPNGVYDAYTNGTVRRDGRCTNGIHADVSAARGHRRPVPQTGRPDEGRPRLPAERRRRVPVL